MALSISKASVFAVHTMGLCFQMSLFKTAFLIVGVFDRCSADCRGKVMNEYYASLNESALV